MEHPPAPVSSQPSWAALKKGFIIGTVTGAVVTTLLQSFVAVALNCGVESHALGAATLLAAGADRCFGLPTLAFCAITHWQPKGYPQFGCVLINSLGYGLLGASLCYLKRVLSPTGRRGGSH